MAEFLVSRSIAGETREGLAGDRLLRAAERYGTPLYVYDLHGLEARYRALSAALPHRVEILYALKANGSLGICKRLADLGCGADVCSAGEIVIAGAAGFARQRTSFTGPGKSDGELRQTVERRLGWIVVESAGEAKRLSAIAAAAQRRQPVLARLVPQLPPDRRDLLVAGAGEKFGIDESDAYAVLARLAELPGITLEGVHVYVESCVVEADRLLAIHRRTLELARALAAQGLPISTVNFGGGLGIAYRPGEAGFDLARYAAGLRELVDLAPSTWRFLLEPGRYLVAEHGAYVVTVVDVKTTRGRRHVIVDGGIHQLYRPRMSHANRRVERLGGSIFGGPVQGVTIGGPLLSRDDVLAEDVELPPVSVGDRLVFRSCGAYAFSHSLMGFSAHPTAAEVAIDGSSTWLLRRRGRPADVLRGQSTAPATADPPPVVAERASGGWRA